jgi:hypothetical protein
MSEDQKLYSFDGGDKGKPSNRALYAFLGVVVFIGLIALLYFGATKLFSGGSKGSSGSSSGGGKNRLVLLWDMRGEFRGDGKIELVLKGPDLGTITQSFEATRGTVFAREIGGSFFESTILLKSKAFDGGTMSPLACPVTDKNPCTLIVLVLSNRNVHVFRDRIEGVYFQDIKDLIKAETPPATGTPENSMVVDEE